MSETITDRRTRIDAVGPGALTSKYRSRFQPDDWRFLRFIDLVAMAEIYRFLEGVGDDRPPHSKEINQMLTDRFGFKFEEDTSNWEKMLGANNNVLFHRNKKAPWTNLTGDERVRVRRLLRHIPEIISLAEDACEEFQTYRIKIGCPEFLGWFVTEACRNVDDDRNCEVVIEHDNPHVLRILTRSEARFDLYVGPLSKVDKPNMLKIAECDVPMRLVVPRLSAVGRMENVSWNDLQGWVLLVDNFSTPQPEYPLADIPVGSVKIKRASGQRNSLHMLRAAKPGDKIAWLTFPCVHNPTDFEDLRIVEMPNFEIGTNQKMGAFLQKLDDESVATEEEMDELKRIGKAIDARMKQLVSEWSAGEKLLSKIAPKHDFRTWHVKQFDDGSYRWINGTIRDMNVRPDGSFEADHELEDEEHGGKVHLRVTGVIENPMPTLPHTFKFTCSGCPSAPEFKHFRYNLSCTFELEQNQLPESLCGIWSGTNRDLTGGGYFILNPNSGDGEPNELVREHFKANASLPIGWPIFGDKAAGAICDSFRELQNLRGHAGELPAE